MCSRPDGRRRVAGVPRGYDGAMADRRRTVVGALGRPCDACGAGDVPVVRSTEVRQGLARLNPAWDARPSTYGLCRSCGARLPV
jgi:hypothetical protein